MVCPGLEALKDAGGSGRRVTIVITLPLCMAMEASLRLAIMSTTVMTVSVRLCI